MTTFCNKKVLFCSIYWPDPDNDTGCWLEKFNIFLDHASETCENMVIGGDLNLSKIPWDSLENTSGTKEVAFLEILNDHFLTQLNFIPTRHDRVLDLVITNVPDRVRVLEVLSPKESDVFTDHGTVSFEFHASTKATHKIKRTVYDYRNGDFDGLRGSSWSLEFMQSYSRQRRHQLGLDLLEGRIYERSLGFYPNQKYQGKKHPALDHKWNHPRSAEKKRLLALS